MKDYKIDHEFYINLKKKIVDEVYFHHDVLRVEFKDRFSFSEYARRNLPIDRRFYVVKDSYLNYIDITFCELHNGRNQLFSQFVIEWDEEGKTIRSNVFMKESGFVDYDPREDFPIGNIGFPEPTLGLMYNDKRGEKVKDQTWYNAAKFINENVNVLNEDLTESVSRLMKLSQEHMLWAWQTTRSEQVVKLMIHEPSLIRMLVNAYQEIGLERGFNYTFLFNFSAEVESAVRHGLDPVWEQYIDQHLGEEMRSYGIDK